MTVRGNQTVNRPWPALWALVIGFFMILMDTTIVSVANPRIMQGLGADLNEVIWVTSAYLLAYAVPLLVTGRLGDRFGPKRLYLIGLITFTLASAWCGWSGSIEVLIAARTLQGLGASMLTPQTMTVITRTFAPHERGRAMSLWGATAAVATLVGPVLGGVLVDGLGWEWIFFVNVPIGLIGAVVAWRLVPDLPTHSKRFDLIGVALWAIAMFCVVFAIQQGSRHDWGQIWGPISTGDLVGLGVVALICFLLWQASPRNPEPLLPLRLFADRNFALASGAITLVGLANTATSVPLVFYFQLVLGLSPTRAALQLAPMALVSGSLAPLAGSLVDRIRGPYLATAGMLVTAAAMVWYSVWMVPEPSLRCRLLLPSALAGVGSAFTYAPIGSTATLNLAPADAGAGSGIYNSVRQVGAVLGSAAIAALIQITLAINLPGGAGSASAAESAAVLPAALRPGFATAMATSMMLPAGAALIGAVLTAFFTAHQRPDWTIASVPGPGATD